MMRVHVYQLGLHVCFYFFIFSVLLYDIHFHNNFERKCTNIAVSAHVYSENMVKNRPKCYNLAKIY